MKSNMALILIVLGAFVTGTAELVVGGILKMISDDLNVSIGAAGQLITAYSLAFAIGTPIVVSLTSRVPRKTLTIASLAVFIAGSLVAAASTGYAVLLLSRAILGVSSGVFAVVAFSAAAKLVPPEQTGRAVGMVSFGVSFSTVAGVPLGVLVSGWWSWQAIFLLLAALSLVVLAAMIRLLPAIEGDANVPFKKQFAVLRNPVILSGLFLSFGFSTSSSLMNTYMVPFVQNVLGLKPAYLSVLLLVIGAFGLAGSRAGGVGVDRWGTRRAVSFGMLASAASLLLLPMLANALLPGVGLIAVWTFAMSLAIPAILTYFIQQAPQSSNLVLGLNTSVLHLGVAVGAAGGGAIADAANTVLYHPLAAGLIALAGFGAGLVSFSLGRRRGGHGLNAKQEGVI